MLPALLAVLTTTAAAADASVLALDAYRLESHLADLPSAGTTSALLEMIIHPATPLTEDAGGFGALDPERVSLLGESWTWTRWRIDGHDVTDPDLSGSAALHLPAAWVRAIEVSMTSRPDEHRPSGLEHQPALELQGVTAGLRTVLPELGDLAPGAIGLMNAISGRHPRERDVPPPTERRRYLSLLELWAVGGTPLFGGHLTVGAELIDTTRQLLDFDPRSGGLATTVAEPGARLSVGLAWLAPDRHTRLMLLGEHHVRDAVGLEAGLSWAESMRVRRDTLLVGAHAGDARVALTLQSSTREATSRSATRELFDVDGEAAEPWQPDGTQQSVRLDAGWHHGPYYLSLDERWSWSSPTTRAWTNRLVLEGAHHGQIDWTARDTFLALGELRAGHADAVELGAGLTLRWDLYAWASHAVNGRGDGSLFQGDLGADLALTTRWGSVTPFVLVSKAPVALTTQVAEALAPERLEGRLSLGDTLLDTWGGSRLSVDPSLVPTQVYTGAVGLAWQLSERWVLRAQGLVKSLDQTLWIEGGRYTVEDGASFLVPGEQQYTLTNLDQDAPIYFGGQLQLWGHQTDEFLVNFAFAVYNVVGRTTPGNGPLANDPGILSRSSANPTLAAGALANTDADRAFLTKAVLGLRLVDTLWGFVSVRHRDGQPFAFAEPRVGPSGQVVLVPDSPRGSPFVYTRPLAGPREDFRLDLDVELSWTRTLGDARLRVSALVANLLDMGNELGEVQVRPARAGRGALESQIPRSLVLSVAVSTP